ncbi:response regulator [Pseudomonas sp. GT1P32]
MLNALVVDDHPFIRASVKMVLAAAGFDVVSEAGNGVDALQLAREHKPELILLDISMPLLDGLDVIGRVTELRLHSKILVLTGLEPTFYAKRCMNAGAHGYLSKSDDLKELSRAIKVIMDGYTHFPILTSSSVRGTDVNTSEQELVQKLSNRELAVLQQLARGFSNKEIGEAMLLSNKTVSNYKNRLIEKLNVKSLIYLADFAKRNKLV